MTSRAALAAARSLDILDYLAANPGQAHTLTELARALEVNASSMHGILGVMAEAGYVVRHPAHKTYRLGPAAAATGQSAIAQDPVVELAMQEVERLTADFDVESVILCTVRDEMVVVGRSGPPTGRFLSFVGQRWPHEPPMGSIFVAWAPDDAVDRWLSSVEPPLDKEAREQYRTVLAQVRADGRAVVVVVGNEWKLGTVEAQDHGSGFVVHLDAESRYRVFYIGHPIFNSFGEVVLGLFVNGPSKRLSVQQIQDLSERLSESAMRIQHRTGGRAPFSNAWSRPA